MTHRLVQILVEATVMMSGSALDGGWELRLKSFAHDEPA